MKKIKIPYLNILPVLFLAFLLFKLVDSTELSFDGVFKIAYGCIAYFVSGLVVAYLLNPAMVFFENLISSQKDSKRTKRLKRGGVIAFLYLLLAGVLTIFVVAIIPTIRNGVREIADNLPAYTGKIEEWLSLFSAVQDPELTGTLEGWLEEGTGVLYNWLQGLDLSTIGGVISNGVSSVATALIRFGFGLIISVYYLYSKETLIESVKKLIYALFGQNRADRILHVSSQINTIFLDFIVSKLLQSMILFIVGMMVLVPIGIPLAPLIALIIAVTNMIPYFGPVLGAVPCVVLVLLYSPVKALWMALYAVGIQILDNTVIGPKITSEQVGISPLLVIAGVTLGGTFGGILGMILGVPLVAVLKLVFYDPYIERKLKEKGIDM